MDATRFDALLRRISATASRRGLLAGLMSGLLAEVPFGIGSEGAAAKRKKKKKKKKKTANTQCAPNCIGKDCGDDGCGGACGVCSGGKLCQGVSCDCASDQYDCQGTCLPLSQCCTDANCQSGEGCFSGTCVNLQGSCPTGADWCVDFLSTN